MWWLFMLEINEGWKVNLISLFRQILQKRLDPIPLMITSPSIPGFHDTSPSCVLIGRLGMNFGQIIEDQSWRLLYPSAEIWHNNEARLGSSYCISFWSPFWLFAWETKFGHYMWLSPATHECIPGLWYDAWSPGDRPLSWKIWENIRLDANLEGECSVRNSSSTCFQIFPIFILNRIPSWCPGSS